MSYIGLQENYNRIRSLMQMAKSDGLVNLAELTFIVYVAQKIGLSKGELDELAKEEGNFSAPFSMSDRKEILYDLIKVMYVDGIVVETELQQLEDLAIKMKIDKKSSDLLINHIKNNAHKMMKKSTFDELLA